MRGGSETSGNWSTHEAVILSSLVEVGWTITCEPPAGFAASPFADAHRLLADARTALENVAMDLFVEARALGLTPSEVADVITRDEGYITARCTFLLRCDMVPESPRPTSAKEVFTRAAMRDRKIAPLLERGIRTETLISTGIDRLVETNGGVTPILTSFSETDRQDDPMWFLSDPIVPSRVARGLLAAHRMNAIARAVDGFCRQHHKWREQIIEGARIWIDEAEVFLQLVASIPGTAISDDDVPQRVRLDIESAVAEQQALVADLRASTAA